MSPICPRKWMFRTKRIHVSSTKSMNQSTAGSVLFTARRIMQLLFGVIGCLYSETLPNLVTSQSSGWGRLFNGYTKKVTYKQLWFHSTRYISAKRLDKFIEITLYCLYSLIPVCDWIFIIDRVSVLLFKQTRLVTMILC